MKKLYVFLFLVPLLFSCGVKGSYKARMLSKESSYYKGGRVNKSGRYSRRNVYRNRKPKKVALTKPKRIYTANISLEVRNIKESREAILKIMRKAKGFLESQIGNRLIIRVPAAQFDSSLKQILLIGVLLNKSIKTYDVSSKYTELERRLKISRLAKARLLKLLKRVKKVEDRVAIIEEIQRLTLEIERYKRTLRALKSFIEFSVIEILLKHPNRNRVAARISPFKWINRLNASSYRLNPLYPKKAKLTSDFVLFDKERHFLARSSGGTFIRTGFVKNEPNGDSLFWKKALENAMKLKNYEIKENGVKNGFFYLLMEYRSLKPFYYMIALKVKGDKIFLVETYFPDEKEKTKHLKAVIEIFSGMEF